MIDAIRIPTITPMSGLAAKISGCALSRSILQCGQNQLKERVRIWDAKKAKALRRNSMVTHERLAKGGMTVNNGRYCAEHPLLIDYLLEKRLITEDGHRAGMDLISLREVALSANGYAKMRVMSEWLGRSSSEDCPLILCVKISKAMSLKDYAIVFDVCFKEQLRSGMKQAFEALHVAMDRVKKDLAPQDVVG